MRKRPRLAAEAATQEDVVPSRRRGAICRSDELAQAAQQPLGLELLHIGKLRLVHQVSGADDQDSALASLQARQQADCGARRAARR